MTNLLFFILFCVVIRNVNGGFGQAVNITDHKYATAIFYDRSFTCVGSIINPRFILTAGHCLINRNASDFVVIVGVDRIALSTSPLYPARRLHIHPRFSQPFPGNNIATNDIGLIELEVAVTYGRTVSSIPLAINSGPEYRLSCKHVLYRRDTTNPNVWIMELRSSNVVVTSLEDCRKFYFGQVFQNQMCVLNVYKTRNPPPGDSGSPIICNQQLFGVLSGGIKISDVRGPGLLFMVAPYLHWIENILIS